MQEWLEIMTALAQASKGSCKLHWKAWYDQLACQRSFSPCQKVLARTAYCPSADSILTKWQGSYEIQSKLGQTIWKTSIPDQLHFSRVLHVNLLKEWVNSPESRWFSHSGDFRGGGTRESTPAKTLTSVSGSEPNWWRKTSSGEKFLQIKYVPGKSRWNRHCRTWHCIKRLNFCEKNELHNIWVLAGFTVHVVIKSSQRVKLHHACCLYWSEDS